METEGTARGNIVRLKGRRKQRPDAGFSFPSFLLSGNKSCGISPVFLELINARQAFTDQELVDKNRIQIDISKESVVSVVAEPVQLDSNGLATQQRIRERPGYVGERFALFGSVETDKPDMLAPA
jgi:hypothetical protein